MSCQTVHSFRSNTLLRSYNKQERKSYHLLIYNNKCKKK